MDAFNAFLGRVEKAIINPAIELLMIAAFVLFVWGVVEFIQGAGNEEKRAKGQQHIIWGLIGLVIMFGARSIVAIIAHSVGAPTP